MGRTPTAPPEVEWSRLSPRGHEILHHLGLRVGAGFEAWEVAAILNTNRHELATRLEHLTSRGEIDARWVDNRMGELRKELVRVSADD